MKKQLLSLCILVAYVAILVRVMVFKVVPVIKAGQVTLDFGGVNGGHPANFIPFATIVPYLLGQNGLTIAFLNIAGNIGLLLPLGFLLPLVFPNSTWKKTLVIAIAVGISIELLQTVLNVGIFDIDDVLLNTLGVMLGYGALRVLVVWLLSKSYIKICIAALAVIAALVGSFYIMYPHNTGPVIPDNLSQNAESGQVGDEESTVPETGDLCGGTGGIGEVVSVGSNSFSIERRDASILVVTLTSSAEINTSSGKGTLLDLKMGDRVTLVGDPAQDGSFTAYAVFVCSTPN